MTDFTLGPGPLTPEFEQVKSDIGIVENGNTATHAIPAGYYVIWKGDLYVAKTDISSGTALSAASGGNLTAKTAGLGGVIKGLEDKVFKVLPYGTDLNDVKESGVYIYQYHSSGSTCHYPQASNGSYNAGGVLIVGTVGANAQQLAFNYYGQSYVRSGVDVLLSNNPPSYGNWKELIAKDQSDVPLGTTLTGSWIAASTSATLVKLTNSITLTKGTWLILVTAPVATTGTPNVTVGPQIAAIDNNQFGAALSAGDQAMRIVNVVSTQEVYAMSAGSAPVTYDSSFFNRGGIRAVKIGL